MKKHTGSLGLRSFQQIWQCLFQISNTLEFFFFFKKQHPWTLLTLCEQCSVFALFFQSDAAFNFAATKQKQGQNQQNSSSKPQAICSKAFLR